MQTLFLYRIGLFNCSYNLTLDELHYRDNEDSSPIPDIKLEVFDTKPINSQWQTMIPPGQNNRTKSSSLDTMGNSSIFFHYSKALLGRDIVISQYNPATGIS